jgi:hypothetical protein
MTVIIRTKTIIIGYLQSQTKKSISNLRPANQLQTVALLKKLSQKTEHMRRVKVTLWAN